MLNKRCEPTIKLAPRVLTSFEAMQKGELKSSSLPLRSWEKEPEEAAPPRPERSAGATPVTTLSKYFPPPLTTEGMLDRPIDGLPCLHGPSSIMRLPSVSRH
ncbi:hypothetical protein RRG08_055312 [Elysia crispata]|uniref:Uncharacterized protein n=1 Tax=Elysia crispata TaxID=231223 RepID=A0AAE1E3E1_9GAST|nr:hypothetical protein RRG08_055312 [Elysia crispata]